MQNTPLAVKITIQPPAVTAKEDDPMIHIIMGLKGTGKTKTLINLVNGALEVTKGDVVCIEKGDKLRFDISYQCRLIDTNEYAVSDAETLYGFVAGILASNHDVTDLFIDSALKICKDDLTAFEPVLDKINALCEKCNVKCVITSSLDVAAATDALKKYIK